MNIYRRKETFATIIPQVSEASSPLIFVDGAQTGPVVTGWGRGRAHGRCRWWWVRRCDGESILKLSSSSFK